MSTLKQLNERIAKKYPGVELIKGQGYFYLAGEGIVGLKSTGIYVKYFSDLSTQRWMWEIDNLMKGLPSNAGKPWEAKKIEAKGFAEELTDRLVALIRATINDISQGGDRSKNDLTVAKTYVEDALMDYVNDRIEKYNNPNL